MSTTSYYVEMKSQCYICFSLTSDEIIEAHEGKKMVEIQVNTMACFAGTHVIQTKLRFNPILRDFYFFRKKNLLH